MFRTLHARGHRRRGLLAVGAGALAMLAVPGGARARPGLVPVGGVTDPARRLIQHRLELTMALPAFEPQHTALIRAVVETPAFQATLDGASGAPPPAVPTGFARDRARARQVRDAFLRLANPRMTAAQRNAFLSDRDISNIYQDFELHGGTPSSPTRVLVRGSDVVDRLAHWFLVAIGLDLEFYPEFEGDAFRSLRDQLRVGYAAAPSTAGLSEQGRHDFATTLFLNAVSCRWKMDHSGASNNQDRSSAAEAAVRSDIRAALSAQGLDLNRLVLYRNGGLRRD